MPSYTLVRIASSPNWYIQWFEGRHSRRASTRTADRGHAEAVLAAFRLETDRQPSGPTSLALVLDWYLEGHAQTLARTDSQELGVKHLKRFFGASLVDDVNLQTQQLYAEHRVTQGVTLETVRRELSVLSAAVQRAFKHERIGRAPPILSLPKSPARERWLTRKEAARLLRYLRNQPRARHILLFTRLALYTGARTTAILELTWDRVDLERGMIWYPVPGKRAMPNKSRAVVPIEPNMVQALKAASRANSRRKGGPVSHVVQWKGEKCARVIQGFKRHARAAGLGDDVTPHVLRHTFATWAAQKGVPMFLIGRTLGQSIAATTERYAKHQPEALRAVTRAVRRK